MSMYIRLSLLALIKSKIIQLASIKRRTLPYLAEKISDGYQAVSMVKYYEL